ncbi:transglycosylase SLT domain-containing protein [Clostridium coskatii]|uniref:Transglycosylase SLT domain protein n=1 Tax=Clostridium coskatii TaxID=1705578 RepID=A0A166RXD9_9CLOT|nr:transglycosylase SLT domain-containing protein [Clostridium coskatii]OAA91330.1 Transglycosylase SLT domain protein [Clostridium coskatii]OBR93962.1 transglycosylase SLT domain protein [Clostridium coskatii]
MSRTIATILNLKDLFSPTLLETVKSTKEFQRQIQHTQNEISKLKSGVSESFGNIKTKVAETVAGLGIAEFAKKSVELASDLVEVQNVVDQTFGSGAAQINNWSKIALNAFGLNQLQAKQFTGYLGAMMKSSGITGSSLTKMSENLVGLAGDMASFDNLDPELAFEKIRSGISGETEPLKEIGINMDVANLKAFALKEGIKKSYESMSQAEQVTLRYNYLMSVTADKHGDFAKTQQTFANQMRIAKGSIEQAGASIATGFLPYLNKLLLMFNSGGLKEIGSVFRDIGNTITSIANSAKTPVQSLVNSLGNLAQTSGLKTLFSGVDSKPLETLKYTINSVIYGVRDLVNFVSNHMIATKTLLSGLAGAFVATKFIQEAIKMQNAISGISEGIQKLKDLSKVGKLFTTIFSVPGGALGFIAIIAAVAAGAYLIINHWTQVKQFVDNFFNSVQGKFLTATVGILGITKATKALGITFTDLKITGLYAADAVKKIGLGIGTGFSKAGLLAKTLGSSLLGIGKSALSAARDIALMTAGIVKQGALWAANALKAGIYKTATLAVAAAERVTSIAQAALNFVMNLNPIVLIITAIAGLVVALVTLYNKNVWFRNQVNIVFAWFGTLPSKFKGWAHDMIQGFVQGIQDKIASVKQGAQNIANTIKKILHFSKPDEGPLTEYGNWMPDFITGMNQGVINTTPVITKGITDMATNMTVPINNFVTSSNTLGVNAIQELSAGISSQTSNAVATAQDLATKILQGVKDIFGIHSPSRKMGDVGINFMQGFINKLKSSNIADVIKTVFGDIASLANGTLGGAISNIVSNFINMGDLKGLGSTLQGIMQYGVGFLSGGGNIGQWIQLAMALTGVSSDWMGPLQEIIQHESGGDPNSINLWDYNAQHGDPSRGLMQLTGENMSDWHLPGMDNIYDPISNIAAGIRLIQHDYGSVYNVPGVKALAGGGSYVGYASGTNSANKGVAELAENGAELVTSRQFRNLKGGEHVYTAQETKGLLGGKSINMTNNFYFKGNVGNDEFFDQAGSHIVTKIRMALNNM